MNEVILTVNAGSSSVRLGVFTRELALLRSRRLEGHPQDVASAVGPLIGDAEVRVVSHRVVHGGPHHTQPCAIDDAVEAAIEEAAIIAPLHNPAALAWVAACRKIFPAARQVAVFDTGFFSELPARAATYALPATLRERWSIRRLGFHGLAHRSMRDALARGGPLPRRLITLQLGAGCSAAALLDGRPIDTSMGFTPLEGLVMASRAGDVDAGLVLYLMRREGSSAEAMAELLSESSGLRGLAGGGDVGALLARQDAEARLAIDVFCYRIRKYLGAYLAALGGCDAVAFGGGIGEHVPAVRARALEGLDGLGLTLDPAANEAARQGAARISPGGGVAVHVVPTDEESLLAADALPFL
jgi:acetate kinase